jgi:heat shock protein HslJ
VLKNSSSKKTKYGIPSTAPRFDRDDASLVAGSGIALRQIREETRMRRLVVAWIFCLLANGLPGGGFAQSEKVGDKVAAESVPGASVPLEKTEWKLIRLGRVAVKGDDLHRQPQIVLDPVSDRASGSGGCNRIIGGYELKGDKLTFARMASTMMACPDGMRTEQDFLKALGKVKRWKIAGLQLELMDGSGKVVAVFKVANSGAK